VHLERTPDPATGRGYRDGGYFADLDVEAVISLLAQYLDGIRSRDDR
jgi:hypothetical protein